MKLLKSVFRSKLSLFLRDKIGFRAPIFLVENESSFLSSDLFFWRTDKDYSTIFKASDILKKFYKIDSSLTLVFFDNEGKFLLKKNYEFNYGMVSVNIDNDLLKKKGFGTFIALNVPLKEFDSELKVTNKCYVGYGKKSCYSMVHGNMIAIKSYPNKIKNIMNLKKLFPAISSRKGKYIYCLQKPNYSFIKMSLIFSNPINRSIEICVDQKKYQIKSKACIVVNIESESEMINIQSNFIWPRPLVWCQKINLLMFIMVRKLKE